MKKMVPGVRICVVCGFMLHSLLRLVTQPQPRTTNNLMFVPRKGYYDCSSLCRNVCSNVKGCPGLKPSLSFTAMRVFWTTCLQMASVIHFTPHLHEDETQSFSLATIQLTAQASCVYFSASFECVSILSW